MRVLFFMHTFSGYFRQFEPALHELLGRGHSVHVGRDRDDSMAGREWAYELQEQYPGLFSYDFTTHVNEDPWYQFKRRARLTRDYLHFLRPEFDETPEFRARARRRAPDDVVRRFDLPGMQEVPVLEAVTRAIWKVEESTPPSPGTERYIAARNPHIALLTPHLMPGSLGTESLRAAHAVGVRTGLCVASWDNLSSKQIIRVRPDVVTVWNQTQKDEAVNIHGLPADRVVATGAQVYDHWFDWKPRPRREFCERVGLAPDRDFILYAGGALFPSAITEAEWARRWLYELRNSSHDSLRDIQVLVRPHPKRFEEWKVVGIEDIENVAFWPAEGRMPVATDAKADFYDSIFHSAAVMGINTSAMIEAGIVGRKVHSQLVPEFSDSQMGTLHFSYLTEVGGGLLHLSESFKENFDQLGAAVKEGSRLADPDGPNGKNPNREFVEAFVRPQGIDRASAPLFADAIEQAASAGPPSPDKDAVSTRTLRRILRPRAERLGAEARLAWQQKWAARGESFEEARHRKSEKVAQAAEKEKARAEKAAKRAAQLEKAAARAEKEAAKEAKEAAKQAKEAKKQAKESARRKKDAGTAAKQPATPFLKASEIEGPDPIEIARQEAARLTKLNSPVVAGPFLGSPREEILYWIPFLNWMLRRYPSLARRTTIVGRPGTKAWYAHLGVDWREYDSNAEAPADETLAIDPALAIAAVDYLRQRRKLAVQPRKSIFQFERMLIPERSSLEGALPERYALADLDFDATLPESEQNAAAIARELQRLAGSGPVILLREPRGDLIPAGALRLADLAPGGVGLEAAAISSATEVVGTLEGLTTLAPCLGVEATAIYDPASASDQQELELTSTSFAGDSFGSFRLAPAAPVNGNGGGPAAAATAHTNGAGA